MRARTQLQFLKDNSILGIFFKQGLSKLSEVNLVRILLKNYIIRSRFLWGDSYHLIEISSS